MKSRLTFLIVLLMIIAFNACKQKETTSDMNIIFLHHSTGEVIWKGYSNSLIIKAVRRISTKFADLISKKARLPLLFETYNKEHNKNYLIKELTFPKGTPYGWNNFPYDYYNIWVKNAGDEPFMEEPTLEMLTKEYHVIIFKHCFPVSNIKADPDSADINSDLKTVSNYKLQYTALRDKLHEFPDTKFILFTGAVQVKANIKEDEAKRAKDFFKWVIDEWDLPGDNVHLWDFYNLETEGGLYFKDEYAASASDSHPNGEFASKVVKLLFNRIIDIVENNGTGTYLTGEDKR
ncbi:MAG: hypothetical protein MUO72_09910 [Bacteroidales bacterium]|nr:hypothetical protein [Bacteroidales bacterium]